MDENLEWIAERLAPGQAAVVLIVRDERGEVFSMSAVPCRRRHLALTGALNTLIATLNRTGLVRKIPPLIEEGE